MKTEEEVAAVIVHPGSFPESRRMDPRRQGELRIYDDIASSPVPGLAIYGGKAGSEAPEVDFPIWLQKEARASTEIKAGNYSFELGEWRLYSVNGPEVVDSPVIQARDAAISIRDAVRKSLRRKVFVLAFLIFPDMDPDREIIKEASRHKVHVIFGSRGIVDEILRVAAAEEIIMPPTASHIQKEAELFIPGIQYPQSVADTPRTDRTSTKREGMDMAVHQVIIQHVDVVNLYTVAGGENPLGQSSPAAG